MVFSSGPGRSSRPGRSKRKRGSGWRRGRGCDLVSIGLCPCWHGRQRTQFRIFSRSPQSIVEDIYQGKSEHYGSETLREILKLLPESEEVRNLARGDLGVGSGAQSYLFYWVSKALFEGFCPSQGQKGLMSK